MPGCPRLGGCPPSRTTLRSKTPRRSNASRPRARTSWERPTCRCNSLIFRATTKSTAPRATPGTRNAVREALRAAPPRHWRPGSAPWKAARISAGPSATPRIFVASTATNPLGTSCPSRGIPCPACWLHRTLAWSGPWRVVPRTWRFPSRSFRVPSPWWSAAGSWNSRPPGTRSFRIIASRSGPRTPWRRWPPRWPIGFRKWAIAWPPSARTFPIPRVPPSILPAVTKPISTC